MAYIGRQRIDRSITISPTTRELLTDYHKKITSNARNAIRALVENDKNLAQGVLDAKPEINEFVDKMEGHLTHRLAADEPNRLYTFRLETEMIDYLKRVFYFSKRIAKLVLEHNADRTDSESAET